ncbi:MAG: hypothetical protein ABIJ96_01095 [Elusimicrobiota bacterium]
MPHYRIRTFAAALLTGAAIMLSLPAAALALEENSEKPENLIISQGEFAVISASSDVLRHIGAARAALRAEDAPRAASALARARGQLRSMKAWRRPAAAEDGGHGGEEPDLEAALLSLERHLAAAERGLEQKEFSAADKALALAEQETDFLKTVINRPLAQAHKNLWRAMIAHSFGQAAAVRKYLSSTSVWLARAAGGGQETEKARADLAKKVQDLEHSMAEGKPGPSQGIESLWQLCVALTEWEKEGIVASWRQYRELRDVYTALSAAKYHLVQAKGNHLAGRDREGVSLELKAARRELRRALEHAPADMDAELAAIDTIAAAIETDAASDKEHLKKDYDTAINQIRIFIRKHLTQPYGWNIQ